MEREQLCDSNKVSNVLSTSLQVSYYYSLLFFFFLSSPEERILDIGLANSISFKDIVPCPADDKREIVSQRKTNSVCYHIYGI